MAMPEYDREDRRLAPVESHTPAPPDLFTDERVELIRNTVAKGAPDDVFLAMIDIAKTRNLDPMAKQISVIQYKKGGDWSLVTTIDGYRAIAGDHPDFAGKDRPEFGPVGGKTQQFNRDYPEWCAVTVYRMVQGHRMPFTAEVWWDEYNGGTYTWNKMPRTMLAKVAESHALRMAFTRSLSGVYTREEMDQAAIDVPSRVVNQDTGEIQQSSQPAINPDDARQKAIRRLHAIGRELGIDHAILHDWVIGAEAKRGNAIESMREASGATIDGLARWMDQNRDRAVKMAADAAPRPLDAAMDAALADATPTNGEDAPA